MVDTSTSPYFDDYNENKKFHKVLYVPKRAVQVRELNQVQSIFQNQIERFADHIFENGSMVIPGESNYNLEYEYITVSGLTYSAIVDILETNTVIITGQTSTIVANVVHHIGNTLTDPITFYLQYETGSDGDDVRFVNGESIILSTTLGGNFATGAVITTGKGSVFTIESGVFYLNGNFIQSESDKIIMSKYTSTPSVVVGFRLAETIVTWQSDNTLLDNASGSTNLNAIGADRLALSLSLEVRGLNESFNRENFIELAKFDSGVLLKKVRVSEYSVLEDTLARRTYDESGDYTVDAFGLRVREHLDVDNNGGLYPALDGGDITKFVVGVEPGKAYVRGYEVENIATQYIPVNKARDTGTINNSAINLRVGNYIRVSALNRLPTGGQLNTITFYSGVPSGSGNIPAGTVLGSARVRYTEYDFVENEGLIYLFDIKNASGVNDSSFVASAGSIYQSDSPESMTAIVETGLLDSINYGLVYELPIGNAKVLSDTTLSIVRQYRATADAAGVVVLTAGTNEVFATPTAVNSVGSHFFASTAEIHNLSAISTLGGVPLGKTLTINFDSHASLHDVIVDVEVIKQVATHKTKTVSVGTAIRATGAFTNNRFLLGKADVFKIDSIIEDSVDRTSSYRLVKNITPEYYGQSYVELISGEAAPTDSTEITFQYFLHGSGDYFSVDSYSVDYEDIPNEVINNKVVNLADCIDFRPRINDAGTGFTGTGSSVTDIPLTNSIFRSDIEHYLPRIDKVFVTTKGAFNVINGVSALDPKEPQTPDNAMAIYKLIVPAYTKSAKDVVLEYINNRRYTMRDIGKLETRISNLEYYTTLNNLEIETNGLQIVDGITGLNRFKNGFVTDNFIDHTVGDFGNSSYKCSVSESEGVMRPEFGIDQVPFSFNSGVSTGVVLTGSLVTLPFAESNYLNQSLASGVVNVNPYAVYLWYGTIKLIPNSDSWFDTVYTAPEITGTNVNVANLSSRWGSWGTNWTGSNVRVNQNVRNRFNSRVVTTTSNLRVTDDRVVDQSVIPFMRSRDISFNASGLLPKSRVYAYFDNVDVTAYCKSGVLAFGAPMYTDEDGKISGVFRIPNNDTLKFRTGTKQFTLIDNAAGDKNGSLSYGDVNYSASGTLVTRTQSIVATQRVASRLNRVDPIAQSFLVEKANGLFVTSVELYFSRKDDVVPVTVELRNMVNGYPGQQVLPYSRKTLEPIDVNVSNDASVATKFTFDSPVYLVDGQEYCYVVLSNSNNYDVYVATMGQKQIGGNTYISKQPFSGVMFKSQNNLTWTADQQSDMKFKINIANFTTGVAGNAVFSNEFPEPILLEGNPLTSTVSSDTIIVRLPNHNMVVGSLVTISGVDIAAAGMVLGQINATHEVDSILDADRFVISVTDPATVSGVFGGDNVICEINVMANTIQPIVQELLFENTNVDWFYRGTSGKSISGSESAYSTLTEIAVTPNENTDLSVPHIIPNETDAADKLATDAARLRANMITYSANVSPAIDINSLGLVSIVNRINNSQTNETNFNNGNAIARYMTQVVGLSAPANSLKVFVDVNMPQDSSVVMMYRVGNTIEEVQNKAWVSLPNVSSSIAADQISFTEFEYSVNNTTSFGFYQFKIVMLSTSSSNVPKFKRFRGIALGT